MDNTFNYINLEYFFNKIYELFIWFRDLFTTAHSVPGLGWLRALLWIAAFLLVAAIIYTTLKILEMREKEHEHLHHKIHHYTSGEHHDTHTNGTAVHTRSTAGEALIVDQDNPRWAEVQKLIQTENPSDWRLAIIEADLMLEQLLDDQGFSGDTLGEKLKNSERGDFATYQNAWDAHKVRNNIAHQGVDFNLTYQDARHAIELYESVFTEFNII